MSLPVPIYQSDRAVFREDIRKHGCGVISTLTALVHAGLPRPIKPDLDKVVWSLLRGSGETLAGFREDGISLDQAAAAIRAASHPDRPEWRIQRRRGVKVTALRDQLRDEAGACAIVAIRRGVIVKAGKAKGFMGGHAIVIAYRDERRAWVTDSLRKTVTSWTWDLLADAMDSFGARPWGNGRGEALVVWPNPTYLVRARAQRDAARAERDNADIEISRLADSLRACEARPPADAAVIAAARDALTEASAQLLTAANGIGS